MRKRVRLVLALHRDTVFLDRLRAAAARGGLEVRVVSTWSDLHEMTATAQAGAVVLVDPFLGVEKGGRPSDDLAALLHRFPSTAVTAVLARGRNHLEHARTLGEWGVVQVIDLEEEDTAVAVRERLLSAQSRPLQRVIAQALPVSISGPARSILVTAAAVVTDGGYGAELARSLHITPRTLLRWCRRANLPPPKRLMAWMRILLAAELLDDPGRTVSGAALACGYAADTSLRQALRAFLNASPSELRDCGAFTAATAVFSKELAAARAEKRYRRLSSRVGE